MTSPDHRESGRKEIWERVGGEEKEEGSQGQKQNKKKEGRLERRERKVSELIKDKTKKKEEGGRKRTEWW